MWVGKSNSDANNLWVNVLIFNERSRRYYRNLLVNILHKWDGKVHTINLVTIGIKLWIELVRASFDLNFSYVSKSYFITDLRGRGETEKAELDARNDRQTPY